MSDLMVAPKEELITSLELVDQINYFRGQEGARAILLHKTLLEIIRNEFKEEIGEQKILQSSYKNSQNKLQPMFKLTPSQAKQVLVRESRFVRKAVIKYIEELEERLTLGYKVPTTFTEALRLAADQQEQLEIQKQIIGELKPAKEYLDQILLTQDTMTITQIGADYGLSGAKLNKILNEERLIRKVGKQWILYSNHMNKGYTKSETIIVPKQDGTEKVVPNTKWTQKGRLKIHEILTNLNIIANFDKETQKALTN